MAHETTGYPHVDALLAHLLAEVRAVLGDELIGFYLYGSLSLGDFDPASSDIDFLAATRGVLPAPTLAALAAMHARIAASGLPYADRLEGSYIPVRALRRYDPADNRHPTIGMDWDFGVAPHKTNWIIERHILREHGRALHGPEWLRTRAYQSFAILTMCRALNTLSEGTVLSKRAAADWAKHTLDPAWTPLIDRALAQRHDHAPDDMTDMLRFVAWAVAQVQAGDDGT